MWISPMFHTLTNNLLRNVNSMNYDRKYQISETNREITKNINITLFSIKNTGNIIWIRHLPLVKKRFLKLLSTIVSNKGSGSSYTEKSYLPIDDVG